MDWTQVLTVFVIVATNLGTVIVLHCHLDSSLRLAMDSQRKETNDIIRSIQLEIKDFHARLCGIEERNKEKK